MQRERDQQPLPSMPMRLSSPWSVLAAVALCSTTGATFAQKAKLNVLFFAVDGKKHTLCSALLCAGTG